MISYILYDSFCSLSNYSSYVFWVTFSVVALAVYLIIRLVYLESKTKFWRYLNLWVITEVLSMVYCASTYNADFDKLFYQEIFKQTKVKQIFPKQPYEELTLSQKARLKNMEINKEQFQYIIIDSALFIIE